MKLQSLTWRQVAELTGSISTHWIFDAIAKIEWGSNSIEGACGVYGICSMRAAMDGGYSEVYEIENDGFRRVALVKL